MISSFLSNTHNWRSSRCLGLLALGLLIAFVAVSWISWRNSPGDDLSSGYIAGHLIEAGNQAAVYSHDSERFHIVHNSAWQAAAEETGFKGFLHPYVQVPLWAAALRPLSTSMTFTAFNSLFVLLCALSIAGMVWFSTKWLSPSVLAPLPTLGILLWLWFSHPFRYTMFLTQTHPLILLATLGALICAERQKAVLSGVLLACAAAIKLTPVLLLLYWVITRRWHSIVWFLIAITGLLLTSLALTGTALHVAFLSELKRVSNVLLVSWNNESLAAFVMGYQYPPSEMMDFRILPLPAWLKFTGTCMALGTISLAGWLRRRGAEEGATVSIALIGMTAFASIAWSHYYVVLLVPLAYLMKRATTKPALWIIITTLILMTLGPSKSLFRPFFTAGMIAMMSCIVLSVHDGVGARSLRSYWRRSESSR